MDLFISGASGLKFVKPAQRHEGLDAATLAQRDLVYREAKERKPQRCSKGTRNWKLKGQVWLNLERVWPEDLKQAA